MEFSGILMYKVFCLCILFSIVSLLTYNDLACMFPWHHVKHFSQGKLVAGYACTFKNLTNVNHSIYPSLKLIVKLSLI